MNDAAGQLLRPVKLEKTQFGCSLLSQMRRDLVCARLSRLARKMFHADGRLSGLFTDSDLARLFEDGTLSKTRMNAKYICIAQTYFFTGLARTLGIPAREINNAIGEPSYQRNDGVWVVRWWQEAWLELYYEGAWHYYDTLLGFTDRKGYLNKNLIYQSWSNFSPQAVPFMTVRGEATGLKGHSFNSWPGDPPLSLRLRPCGRCSARSSVTNPDANWSCAVAWMWTKTFTRVTTRWGGATLAPSMRASMVLLGPSSGRIARQLRNRLAAPSQSWVR